MEPNNLGKGRVVRATGKALLVRLLDLDDEEVWIPKSVIHDDSEVYAEDSDDGSVVVQEWWARANGLG